MNKWRVTHTEHFDYYETERSPWYEIAWYYIKSMLSGLGMVTVAFLIGYLSAR